MLRTLSKTTSLSARITLLLVVISLLVLGGGAVFMDWRIDHELESRIEQNLLTQAKALSSLLQAEEQMVPPERLPVQATVFNGDDPTYYEVRCPGISVQRSSPPLPTRPTNWSHRVDTQPRFATLQYGSAHLAFVQFSFNAAPDEGEDESSTKASTTTSTASVVTSECVMLFAQDRHAIDEILRAVDWILLLGPALALLIALAAVPLIVRRGMRPMTALVERMHAIGPNAPGQRLPPSGVRELDPLITRFNDVLARMDDGLARERQFASGLAHETRTRLAELRALTEVEVRYPSGRSLPDLLSEIGSIGAELEATVTALLLLTRLQSAIEPPQLQPVMLTPWLTHQQQRVEPAANARGITLRCEGSRNVCLHTDPALLEVVVRNLLANACAYAPTGDTVTLRVAQDGVCVDNAAPELTAEDLASFGQRFWRKQLPHAAHAGLGLALAGAAATALNMTLSFRLDPQQRLQATLTWPNDMTREVPA